MPNIEYGLPRGEKNKERDELLVVCFAKYVQFGFRTLNHDSSNTLVLQHTVCTHHFIFHKQNRYFIVTSQVPTGVMRHSFQMRKRGHTRVTRVCSNVPTTSVVRLSAGAYTSIPENNSACQQQKIFCQQHTPFGLSQAQSLSYRDIASRCRRQSFRSA